jgi:holo-[acyl-carrier protein] synthase
VILGTGIDIIEVERIRDSHARFGERFIKRILRPGEIAYCLSHKLPAPHIAARFAAKEAISKAFGTGIGQHLHWHDMEIQRKDSGEPFVVLHDRGITLLGARGGRLVHISLSHTQGYAAAVAILET